MSEKQILASEYAKRLCDHFHEKVCNNINCQSCGWYRLSLYEERKEAFIKGFEVMQKKALESICNCCPLNHENCNCADESRRDKTLGILAAPDSNCLFIQKFIKIIQ